MTILRLLVPQAQRDPNCASEESLFKIPSGKAEPALRSGSLQAASVSSSQFAAEKKVLRQYRQILTPPIKFAY
jgi:hypothetical protein